MKPHLAFRSVALFIWIALLDLQFLIGFVRSQYPASFTISGIVRDFSSFSPPFEDYGLGTFSTQTGAMNSSLNSKGRPAVIPSQYRSNFPYWRGKFFTEEETADIPGVNLRYQTSFLMTLYDASKGTYQYNNQKYFPIDGIGFGAREGVSGPHNFGFCSELNIPFYYRGGETFSFSGDDDVFVWIGNQLVCDIGGVHPSASCPNGAVNLDTLGLTKNNTYSMIILECERHITGSTFLMTTTILPTYHAPLAFGAVYSISDAQSVPIILTGSVSDQGITIQFAILSPFSISGNLTYNNAPIGPNTLIPVGASLLYTPLLGFNANDTFSFIAVASSGLNSTTAFININVTHIRAPPQAFPATISCQTPNTVTTQLIASSNDTSKPKLSYLLQTHPIFGASVLDQNTGLLTFQCTSTEGGSETLQWYVYDGYSTGFNTINITVTGVPPPAPVTVTLSAGTISGIVVGGMALFIIIGVLIVYYIYQRLLARRFDEKWRAEWANAQLKENPLYKSNQKETFNPLYQRSDTAPELVLPMSPTREPLVLTSF